MDIAIRIEGGVGDHLLANRFVHAIKQKNPKSNIEVFSDTEGNPRHLDLIRSIFPSLYENSTVMTHRGSKTYTVLSQFGKEIYTASPENVADEYKQKFNDADKYYNLCLDNMDWIYYDFDWKKWFRFFPEPEVVPTYDIELPDKFLLANFYSRPDSPYLLEQWYIKSLIDKLTIKYKLVIPVTDESIHFYSFCEKNPNVKIIRTDLKETFFLASKCEAFIGIDSGIRCMPYHFNKPAIYFSNFVKTHGQVPIPYLLRWIIYENFALPMYMDIPQVMNIIHNSINSPICEFAPTVPVDQVDNYIYRRILSK